MAEVNKKEIILDGSNESAAKRLEQMIALLEEREKDSK